jgi:Fe-S-cluster-containing hydrogenase component 2
MRAITFEGDQVRRDEDKCFNCGLCIGQCVGGAFGGSLGAIKFEGRRIPVVLRQSDRARAIKLAEELKQQILDGSFRMTQMVDHI